MGMPSDTVTFPTPLWEQVQRLYPNLAPTPAQLRLIEALDKFHRDYHPKLLIVETDPQGIITYTNEDFAQLGGYTPAELLGQNINILRSDANETGYFRDLWNTITSGNPWRGRIKNRSKDYELYEIDMVILPIADATGSIQRYLAFAYDTTHRLETEKQLIQLRTDFEEGLRYARRIQRAIFPTRVDALRKFFPESFLLANGRDIVSGDFCWTARSPMGNRTFLAVADCTGHGIPGGLLTVIGYNLLNQIVLYRGITVPHQILMEMHKGLREYFLQEEAEEGRLVKDGMDIILCSFDYGMTEVQFAGANRPLWLVRNGELQEFKTDKQPIGGERLAEDVEFQVFTLELEAEDRLYLFTDGITDQFGGPNDKRFGTPRLRQTILQIWNEPSMARQRALFNNIWKREWMGDTPPTDDATLVGIRIVE
ncbi:MAG: SpoIIE family protein phosphatase [Bacteroidia bacterium]|nr:SpoIIE family protein phosphatase [Bacteroidia bacterium]MCX7652725.1 SpoIIE family protein phosphatase [Bacteroidia bacterium]MDW8416391.1 SpoIIE family protein phosphatase [Bacteroidia bacterium]